MSLLLLVRSADDMRSAAKAASELVAYQRQRFAGDRETGDVVGIWLKRDLDAELPAWPWADRQLRAGPVIGPASFLVPPEPHPWNLHYQGSCASRFAHSRKFTSLAL